MKFLSTLTVILTSSVTCGALVDYGIDPAATPLTVTTFNGGGDSVTIHFVTGSDAAATSATCELFEISGTQCDRSAPISPSIMDEGTLAPVASTLDVPISITLANLATAPTNVYSFSDVTNKGTINFCSRCYTTTNGMNPDYAEVLATIVLDMEGSINLASVAVDETDGDDPTDETPTQSYDITAFECMGGRSTTENAVTRSQGDYVEICILSNTAGVNCNSFEQVLVGPTYLAVDGGTITATDLAEGNDQTDASPDGICYLKTQFPSSLVPVDGSPGTFVVTGTVLLEFGTRRLRGGQLSGDRDLQSVSTFHFEMEIPVQINSSASTVATLPVAAMAFAGTVATALFL